MKKQITAIVLGGLLAIGVAAPSFAQSYGGTAAHRATHSNRAPAVYPGYSAYPDYSGYYDSSAGASGYGYSGPSGSDMGGIGR